MSIEQQLTDIQKAAAEQTAASQSLAQTVTAKMGQIDQRVEQSRQKFEKWMADTEAVDIQGEGRYFVELTVNGDKDTFYPVYFQLPMGDETTIQIFRHYDWNNNASNDPGDFDTTHVASALVILKGQTYPWNGDANYLRTVVNYQRYRECVSGISHKGYVESYKYDPEGVDSSYNGPGIGFRNYRYSSFHLRGGKLKYRIYSNKPITYMLKDDGELADAQNNYLNYKWLARTMHVNNLQNHPENDHGTVYIGYPIPAKGASA